MLHELVVGGRRVGEHVGGNSTPRSDSVGRVTSRQLLVVATVRIISDSMLRDGLERRSCRAKLVAALAFVFEDIWARYVSRAPRLRILIITGAVVCERA